MWRRRRTWQDGASAQSEAVRKDVKTMMMTEELVQNQGARLPMWKERRIPEVLWSPVLELFGPCTAIVGVCSTAESEDPDGGNEERNFCGAEEVCSQRGELYT